MFNVGLFLNVCIITFASFYPYMQSFIFFNKTDLHWSSLCKETGKQMRLVEILRENTDVLGLSVWREGVDALLFRPRFLPLSRVL